MKISAKVQNEAGKYWVNLQTGDHAHLIEIPPKPDGEGSSANGGEVLSLALATCYCNDIYREAAKRGIKVQSVEVEVDSEFGAEGAAAKSISYRAKVVAQGTEEEIRNLMKHTDAVAEIQNTLRTGIQVSLKGIEAVSRK